MIPNDRLSEKKWTFMSLQAISHFFLFTVFPHSLNTLKQNEMEKKANHDLE